MDVIQQVNRFIWGHIEDAVTPRSQESRDWAIIHYGRVVLLPIGMVTAALEGVLRIGSWFQRGEGPFWDGSQDLENIELHVDRIGFADATTQNSETNCQWKGAPWSESVPGFYRRIQTHAGRAEIVAGLRRVGSTVYRFSVEWSQIQPTREGGYNEVALQPYIMFAEALRLAGIEPVVTLHHFAEPMWVHETGCFEDPENVQAFVEYAGFVVEKIQRHVKIFYTVNEPAIDAFSRYIRGAFSPNRLMRFTAAGRFMAGAFRAHCLAYARIKEINADLQVGFIHQRLKFRATNCLITPVMRYLNRLVNEAALTFMVTGRFVLKIPFCCHFDEEISEGPPPIDRLGLQYYVRPVIGMMGPTSPHGEPMTAMPFHEDPEGMIEALQEMRVTRDDVTIDITESGISTHDPEQYRRYMKRLAWAVANSGIKVSHWHFWTAWSRYEWDMGFGVGEGHQNFPFFRIEENGTLTMEPREGSDDLIAMMRAHREAALAVSA